MAYYWITEAQRYIQSLGFGDRRCPPVNIAVAARAHQPARLRQLVRDRPPDGRAALRQGWRRRRRGRRGDPARVRPRDPLLAGFVFASEEAGAISEGFGDYWAVDGLPTSSRRRPIRACVADWDSVSYTSTVPHCLRRVDTDLHYPDDLNGEVHHDGQIWSRALWDIRARSARRRPTR